MKRSVIWIVLALLGILGASVAGYWFGTRQGQQVQAPAVAERKILYYRNPMGLPDTSPVPKKDEMGMDYIPVYSDDTPAADQSAPLPPAERKVLYYRNPMGLPDTSPVPKQDSMGMDYVPVYEGDEPPAGQVKISPDKVQKLGVRTEPAVLREMQRSVRAVGQFAIDERRLHTVNARFEGYIEKLYVNATGQKVGRGQPLMQVYSPELVAAQEEYLVAWNGRKTLEQGTQEAQLGVGQLADSALKRLRTWDIPEAELQRLQREGKATRSLTLYAPAGGVVLEKPAVAGMRFMPGEPLFSIADLSSIWLIADVFEQDMAAVRLGQKVEIHVDAYPDKPLTGRVSYIYPTVAAETRSAKVRVELANPGGMLRPEMYASVQFATAQGASRVLAVPESAVLDSGLRQVVLVQLGDGLFEPREVKLGARGDGYAEVLQGVGEGEPVVVRANFLIDAESNLKAALAGFASGQDAPVAPTAPAGHEGH